jgi:DtxR family Mn-dependent transcriptional regulator
MESEFFEEQACEFEHILSAEIADSICTLLNHPRECPHGGKIPEGECCKQAKLHPERVVVTLSELKAGQKGKILYYLGGPEHKQMHQLTDLGIAPGEEVTVHQTFPAAIIRAGETEIALDKNILKRIFVRKMI